MSRDQYDADRLDKIHWRTMLLKLPRDGVALRFPSAESARQRIMEVRWPEGPACPRCASRKVYELATRPVLKCRACKHQFSAVSGTPLHASHVEPQNWFIVAEAVILSRRGAFRRGGSEHEYALLDDLEKVAEVGHATASRMRRVVIQDLERGGVGLLRRCVCVELVLLPDGVEIGTEHHLGWLMLQSPPDRWSFW